MKLPLSEKLQSLVFDVVESVTEGKSPEVYNLCTSSDALFLALLSEIVPERIIISIVKGRSHARRQIRDLLFYRGLFKFGKKGRLLYIPHGLAPQSLGLRLKGLFEAGPGDVLFITPDTLYMNTYLKDELQRRIIKIEAGAEISRPELIEALQRAGYRRVAEVTEPGGFSYKRWIIDIFPAGEDQPIRVEFFGDQVDSVRFFDIESQVSGEPVSVISIYPAIDKGEGIMAGSYLIDKGLFVDFVHSERLPGEALTIGAHEIRLEKNKALNMPVLPLTGLGILRQERRGIQEIADRVKGLKGEFRIVFSALTTSQAERIKEILKSEDIIAPLLPPERVSEYEGSCVITTGGLSEGLRMDGLILISASDLFGKAPEFISTGRSRLSKVIERLDEISVGDYVVHKKHGIGIFRGLKKLSSREVNSEVVEIEYRDGIRIYLPVQNISMLQKYRAEEGVIPKLDRPGSRNWERKKERIRKRIKQMAERLVRLYAHREVLKGFAFSEDTELHREFESFFPFELTPDQERTWQEVKSDMESSRPMDRLICGDVGFGKTEIAMRAAFKAVFDGKQVAVLVPTTLLCEQHYRTFTARFSAFPVKIDYLSRFKTPAERKQTLKRLKEGDIDIIIGTHALLGKRVEFFDLGLLVVDEEHRFGVTHKERIKELRKKVDCLSLSATPIPRTLEMSLSGIREMSLIETPPEERLAVRGIVTVFNEDVIREAIERELKRGGQVFFVHNRVNELGGIERMLRRLVPLARLSVAHGQMPERELEEVMHRFVNREIDILLCTSIIGSGIDLPSANTIIINRADRMGLADLYQLKGRVGRGSEEAWAYFLIPPPSTLTEEARRRIRAIEELNYLGAGLSIAMRDLEIRGAGNLLGKEQSGHIHEIGLDLYMEMLSREVARLKGQPLEEEFEPVVDLSVPAFVPEQFVDDTGVRLGIYRRLSLCKSPEDVEHIKKELADRFGPPPEEVENLLAVMKIKTLARRLRAERITDSGSAVMVQLRTDTALSVERLLELSSSLRDFRLKEDGFYFSLKSRKTLLEEVTQVMSSLASGL